jgi:RND family efflux transporter MFP subunit
MSSNDRNERAFESEESHAVSAPQSVEPRGPAAHETHDPLGFELPPPTSVSATRLIGLGLLASLVLGGAFAATYIPKRRARAALEAHAVEGTRALPRVEYVLPHQAASERQLMLPGSVHPLEETVIYPRANGYVRRWLVDIGDRVTEGQLLAEIDTPELDQEISQARAQLAQAEAQVAQATAQQTLAHTEVERYRTLATTGYSSRSELDQHEAEVSTSTASVGVARANVGVQRANLRRLLDLKAFARVTAPFAGTITARSIDRGELVTAGTGTPLFHLAATDPARVIVQVPQDLAPSVRPDLTARVVIREFPERPFEGVIARTSGALDSATRTLTTEIRVPNPDNVLLAGMYADVTIALPTTHRVFEIPATAVLNDAHGTRIEIVDDEGVIHHMPITIERDTGVTVQIPNPLSGHEHVLRIGNAELVEGTHVDAVAAPAPAHPAH